MAAGGAVYRNKKGRIEVLLIHRNGIWDLPKGKIEEGESKEEAARREVAEETGIPLPQIKSFLRSTYHEYERDGTNFGKTTFWYRMIMDEALSGFTPQTEEGIEAVQWVVLEEAEKKVGYENLREVLLSLKKSLG